MRPEKGIVSGCLAHVETCQGRSLDVSRELMLTATVIGQPRKFPPRISYILRNLPRGPACDLRHLLHTGISR